MRGEEVEREIHRVSNNRVSYTLELERNITILTGESGFGKTAQTRLVQNCYEECLHYTIESTSSYHQVLIKA